ncbi:MAG TPA: hypothetical protein VJ932_02470 [Alkalispirochaeta sp.]|nr:hypothetical protein [Alkalispirochaeta sp.]
MTVAEQHRREQEEYQLLLPEIVAGIRDNTERVSLSRHLSQRTEHADQTRLYRWIQFTEEKLEAQRRRDAGLIAGIMWLGVVAVVVPTVGALLGRLSFDSPLLIAVVVVGAVTAGWAAFRLRGVTSRAYQRWLERETA